MPEIKKSPAVMAEMGYRSLTAPKRGDSEIAKREKDRMRRILRGEAVETKAESYRRLKLHARFGVL